MQSPHMPISHLGLEGIKAVGEVLLVAGLDGTHVAVDLDNDPLQQVPDSRT